MPYSLETNKQQDKERNLSGKRLLKAPNYHWVVVLEDAPTPILPVCFVCFCILRPISLCSQGRLQLKAIILPQLSDCWDYRHEHPCSTTTQYIPTIKLKEI